MGVLDRDRCIKVSGLLGSIILAKSFWQKRQLARTALKTHTSLFLLAEAMMRRKLISCHISQASHIHGFKGRPHKTPQNYHEIPFGCFPVLNRALNGMLRSRSCGISIRQENLRYARYISLLEDIASFFSSNKKMRKSGKLLDSCIDRNNCL